jgi:hypothetical protein
MFSSKRDFMRKYDHSFRSSWSNVWQSDRRRLSSSRNPGVSLARRRVHSQLARRPKQFVSSTAGRFEFPDLPPGGYRLLPTFDLSEVDEETLDARACGGRARRPSQAATADLSPWIAP